MKKLKTKIKRGSNVLVISGSHKGKKGKVLRILPKSGRVIVEKVALIKKHQKPSQNRPEGEIVECEGSIHISNVKLLPEQDKKTDS